MLGLINPGDEVILFAPFCDSYNAILSMAGAEIKTITLRPPDFAVRIKELKSTISKNTRAILVNILIILLERHSLERSLIALHLFALRMMFWFSLMKFIIS
jgi:hypothetical protein